jgi:predicted MFS family arabinose efflux permease
MAGGTPVRSSMLSSKGLPVHALARWASTRFHYGWIVVGIVFFVLLASAGIRATPSVLMVPLEVDLGWHRTTISLAIAINLVLFGLSGPFAAAAMQRYGLRRTVITAVSLLAASAAASAAMQYTWQFVLLWGGVIGAASGAASATLSVTVVNRWFAERRGLALGILTASTATGQMIFLPLMAAVIQRWGWRPVTLMAAAVGVLALLLAATLLPERPSDIALRPVGQPADAPDVAGAPARNPLAAAIGALREGVRNRDFWLLFLSFFVCGASTNGYIGSHFIAMCGDYGMSEVTGASILATMGILDLVGTTLSGWLSDRFSSRVLLFWYYGLRGLSLIYLPHAFDIQVFGLPLFATFYGLDWIATVPPTVRLTNEVFGKTKAPVVFGWIFAGHQLGAAVAAYGAGVLRTTLGNYTLASTLSGALCVIAALLVLRIAKPARPAAVAA